MRGLHCRYEGGYDLWRVPSRVTAAEFILRGADDPAGGSGGTLRAVLSVRPGQAYVLQSGAGGGASAVSRGGRNLLVAEGGNREMPTFPTSPTAVTVDLSTEPAGAPLPPHPGPGSIQVTWFVNNDPRSELVCVVPALEGRRPVVARRLLRRANCAARVTRIPDTGPDRVGRVAGQVLRPGTVVLRNTAIPLLVPSCLHFCHSGGTPR